MATQVQRRRGTTTEHSTFTGAEGELTVDTTKDTVVVHDGATAGGQPLAREDLDNVSSADVTAKVSAGTTSAAGKVQLEDSTTSTSTTTAATPNSVKVAKDAADAAQSTADNALASSGGTITGPLTIGTDGSLTFEGATTDDFETTLAITDPTADRTITLPDIDGTLVTTGDTGTVTSTMIADGTIVDGDISASAEIAVSKLANGTARQILQTDAAGTGVEFASNIDVPGTLDVTGNATFDANVTVQGDLTVNGTTTTIDTETLLVKDKNIEMGVVDTPTDTTADGGGITLKGATDKTINWIDSTDSWTSSENVDLASGKTYKIAGTDVLSATTLGSGVVNSSLTSVGNLTDLTVDTDTLVVDATNDRVGVNTASPTAELHIASTTTPTIKIEDSDNGFDPVQLGATNGGRDFTFVTNQDYYFNNASSTYMTIDSSGRVGIGTTSPQTELHLKTSGATGPTIRFEGTAPLAADSLLGGIDFFNIDGSGFGPQVGAFVRANAVGSGGDGGYLAFGTNDAATGSEGADATEKMRIDATGRLLVGTSTSTTTNNLFEVAHSGVAKLQFGNIGTSNNSALRISRNDTTVLINNPLGYLEFGGNDSTSNIDTAFAWIGAEADAEHAPGDNPTRLVFSTTAASASTPTERMRIGSTGNIGIGTTTTTATRLHVRDDLTTAYSAGSQAPAINTFQNLDTSTAYTPAITQWQARGSTTTTSTWYAGNAGLDTAYSQSAFVIGHRTGDSTYAERLRIDGSGRVGIGTTSPAAPLDISNSAPLIRLTDSDGTNTYGQISASTGALIFAHRNNASNGQIIFQGLGGGAASEYGRFDSSGRLLVGISSSTDPSRLVVKGNTSADIGAGNIALARGESAANMANNDNVGTIRFTDQDGIRSADILSQVDGTPGTNVLPGRLIFATNSGASGVNPTERLRISSDGAWGLSGANYGTSGQVLTSNGSSAAPSWQDAGAGGLFTSYALIRDEKASTTDGGSSTATTWITRDLNTEVADPDGIVSIASNQFTLSAGTYLIRWSAPAYDVTRHQSRLYDVTNTASIEVGASMVSNSTSPSTTRSDGAARVTITAATVYEIQHQTQNTKAANGFGVAADIGTEVYTTVEIFKES